MSSMGTMCRACQMDSVALPETGTWDEICDGPDVIDGQNRNFPDTEERASAGDLDEGDHIEGRRPEGPRDDGPASFDVEIYAKAKPVFLLAARKFAGTTDDVVELMRRIINNLAEKYGLDRTGMERLRPYILRFMEEYRDGKIDFDDQDEMPRIEAVTQRTASQI